MIAEGLSLGPLGIALYFLVIALWSAVVAYVVIFGNDRGGGGEAHDAHAHAPASASHGVSHAAPVEPTRAKPFRGFSPYEGFKSYAQGETVTVEDIVKGLARESGATAIHNAHMVHEEAKAHDSKKAASSAQANAFLELMVQGERDATFDMLRDIEEHGEGAEPFLRRVLTAVEAALETRMGGATCDIRVTEILGNCDTPVLERLVAALQTADKGKQAGKLALTRAFGALKE
jgi:hypothetical protein